MPLSEARSSQPGIDAIVGSHCVVMRGGVYAVALRRKEVGWGPTTICRNEGLLW